MKGLKSVILLIIAIVFLALGTESASAAVNVFVNATMPYDVLHQGEIVSANVTIKNNENFPVRVYSVGVHYDWMPDNVFSSVDFGGTYLQIESNGMTTPGQLLIQCYDNVSTGYHSYYYKVELTWYNSYTSTWLNETVVQPGTIFVESPLKPQALQELQFANKTLSDARAANYVSKRAVSDVSNATELLNDGWSAYASEDYRRALNDSSDAVAQLSDAKIAEKNYRDNATQIETIIIGVNDKLKTIASTSDPDTKVAIAETKGYLNQTRLALDVENFSAALTYANLADNAADNAIQKQFYSSLKANETEAAKNKASAAIGTAQAKLDNLMNITSTSAMGIINDARTKMSNATVMFDQKDYVNATITANVVSSLVDQACSDEASYRMLLARNKLASVGELKSPDAIGMLANASALYNQSERDFIASNFKDCVTHADSAASLADSAIVEDQKWRDSNPLSAVTPGFEALLAILALCLVFIKFERKG